MWSGPLSGRTLLKFEKFQGLRVNNDANCVQIAPAASERNGTTMLPMLSGRVHNFDAYGCVVERGKNLHSAAFLPNGARVTKLSLFARRCRRLLVSPRGRATVANALCRASLMLLPKLHSACTPFRQTNRVGDVEQRAVTQGMRAPINFLAAVLSVGN